MPRCAPPTWRYGEDETAAPLGLAPVAVGDGEVGVADGDVVLLGLVLGLGDVVGEVDGLGLVVGLTVTDGLAVGDAVGMFAGSTNFSTG